jgi:hypothetical protein
MLYLSEAAPSVGGGNSGEFQVMSRVMGIAHPPSYPLYLALAKVAAIAPLPGDTAWRINVFTALLGAVAVYLAGVLPAIIAGSTAAAYLSSVVTAAAVGAMPRLWSLSVEAEVFTLHLALALALWTLLLVWRDHGDSRLVVAAALVAGLGLANHRTFLFIAATAALCVVASRPRHARLPALVAAGVAALGAALPYVWVLRGLWRPVPLFAPDAVQLLSAADVWYIVQGNASGEAAGGRVVLDLIADPARLAERGAWLWRHLTSQFGPAGGALSIVGAASLIHLAVRQPVWTLTSMGGAGAAALFAMAYGKYPDADRYLLPLEVLVALGIGLATGGIARQLADGLGPLPKTSRLAGLALGVVFAGYWGFSVSRLAEATSYTRGGYVHYTLANLEGVQHGAVVCSWWTSAWGWWYARYVDGHRPDVTVVPKGPDECLRDVVPAHFGRRPVYLPALTAAMRASEYAFFPSRDLWLAVAVREPLVDGALVKGPDEHIFLMDGGVRRRIVSLEVFGARGYSWADVRLTPAYVLDEIPEGVPISS